YSVYMRDTDGSPAIRLGSGYAGALSPDRKWAISVPVKDPRQLVLLPTGVGEPRALTNDRIDHDWAQWFPDGKRFFFRGSEPGRPPRIWVQEVGAAAARAVTPEGASYFAALSSDGKRIAVGDASQRMHVYPVDGGEAKLVAGVKPNEAPIRFDAA